MEDISPHNKRVKKTSIGVLVASVSVVTFMFAYMFVHAQTFFPPPNPAPDNTGVNVLSSVSGYLRTNETLLQSVSSPLSIAASRTTVAQLNPSTDDAAIIGSAGDATPPTLTTIFGSSSSAAVYGYATADTSYGAYGYVDDANGVGVMSVSDPAGIAGQFVGAVEIVSGNLDDDNAATASKIVITSADTNNDGFRTSNAASITGGFETGIKGHSDTFYGVLGFGEVNDGIKAVNTINNSYDGGTGLAVNSSDAAYGIFGKSEDPLGDAGVYGLATAGAPNLEANGIEAVVDEHSSKYAAEGIGLAGSGFGNGVYGRGGAFAGYFEGDVNITGSLEIGSYVLTGEDIGTLITWCNEYGTIFCPDPYN